ncbi:MAG: pitrilysin family protein, partial [Acidimicrobiia bacterium]
SGEDVDHEFVAPTMKPVVNVVTRDTEQAHVVLGGEGLDRADERRWAFEVMNHVLGGGMSSRLFTTIREERGLVYTVYSFRASYADTGAWGVYAGTTPEQVGEVLELIHSELELMVRDGITEDELDRARGAMRGGLALAMEDANSRMVRLGRDELVGAPHLSVGERLAKVEAVTLDDIRLVAESLLSAPKVIGAVGPFDSADLGQYLR